MSEPRPARSLWEQALPASSSSPADIPKTPRIEITRKRQTCLLRFLPNSMEYAAIRSMDKHVSKHLETKHLAADVVHYREYKILLQPDRFTSKNGFLEFWETASKTLKKLGLKVDVDEHAFDSQVREVLFYDTPEFDLYNNHFILRKRTFYDQGWPRPGHELAFKYRTPELKNAAA